MVELNSSKCCVNNLAWVLFTVRWVMYGISTCTLLPNRFSGHKKVIVPSSPSSSSSVIVWLQTLQRFQLYHCDIYLQILNDVLCNLDRVPKCCFSTNNSTVVVQDKDSGGLLDNFTDVCIRVCLLCCTVCTAN